MNNLEVQPRTGRHRALSINTYDEVQQNSMSHSLDQLDSDLSLIQSQWHRIITDDSNPLELALKFLDDTSVGLGHRFGEFNQLKDKIGYDLQQAVNEHYQVFNTNIASYSVAVNSITDVQDNIEKIEDSVKEANTKIFQNKGALQELNDNTMSHTKMIDTLSAIEEVIVIPEKIDDHIRKEEYREAQKLLQRALFLSNTHSLWSLSALAPVKQQIDLAEHNLFQNIIDEIHDIIYSKRNLRFFDNELLQSISCSKSDFTSLENYLYTIVSIDIAQQSDNMSTKLTDFLERITKLKADKSRSMYIEESTEYDRIFNLLTVIHSLDRLPLALRILVDRTNKELHDITIQSSEEMRLKYPSLLKVSGNSLDAEFGISMKNGLSVIMREWFWKIFTKILLSVQRHRIVYESISVFESLFNIGISYRFEEIWKRCLIEVKSLLNKYLNDPLLEKNTHGRRRGASTTKALTQDKLFSMQDNLQSNSIAKDHATELKSLLQDMFPGFTVPTNINLSSIYVEEESYEEEEALIRPTIFNMKLMLEPLLLFIHATSNIIPSSLIDKTKPSMAFCTAYMEKIFMPKFEFTFYHMFDDRVFSNNPYAFELNSENKNMLKSAIEFHDLFSNTLTVMNTTYTYRKNVTSVILNILDKFQNYYENVFQTLLGVTTDNYTKKILGIWMNDKALMGTEFAYLKNSVPLNINEAKLFFKHCDKFYEKDKCLKKDDTFNDIDLDVVLHLYNSIGWSLKWLREIRKTVDTPDSLINENSNVNELRLQWSLYDSDELSQLIKSTKLKLSMNKEAVEKFDSIVEKIDNLKLRILTSLRYDLRARAIYNIGKMFETNLNWSPDVGSTELESSIGNLISDIRMHENKLKFKIGEEVKTQIITGIDIIINYAFISAASSIKTINTNGIKKICRNVTYLQNVCRNAIDDSGTISMSNSISFYSACDLSEQEFFRKVDNKELEFCTNTDLKNILRLIFGEEATQPTRKKSEANSHIRVTSMSRNKRYLESLQKIDSVSKPNE